MRSTYRIVSFGLIRELNFSERRRSHHRSTSTGNLKLLCLCSHEIYLCTIWPLKTPTHNTPPQDYLIFNFNSRIRHTRYITKETNILVSQYNKQVPKKNCSNLTKQEHHDRYYMYTNFSSQRVCVLMICFSFSKGVKNPGASFCALQGTNWEQLYSSIDIYLHGDYSAKIKCGQEGVLSQICPTFCKGGLLGHGCSVGCRITAPSFLHRRCGILGQQVCVLCVCV